MIFGIENWLWKSNFGTFWQLTSNPPFENSTTRIIIMLSNNNSTVLDKKVVLQNTQKHLKKSYVIILWSVWLNEKNWNEE